MHAHMLRIGQVARERLHLHGRQLLQPRHRGPAAKALLGQQPVEAEAA